MNNKLSISSHIHTYLSKDFFSIRLDCSHDYYINKTCTDISFEPTPRSKSILLKNNIFYKKLDHELFLGRKKSNHKNDKYFNSTLPPSVPIFIQIKVTNPRFWLVTDISPFKIPTDSPKEESLLVFKLDNKGKILRNSIIAFKKEAQKKYELQYLPKNIFGIIELDLKKILEEKAVIKLDLKASKVKLKYKIRPSHKNKTRNNKQLTINDLLTTDKVLTEVATEKKDRLVLSVKKIDGYYEIESIDQWSMQQENLHQNANFFKFETDVEDYEKAKEGKADIFLPFPNRIKSSLFKKIGKTTILEQQVSLLRFGAKPGPKK